MKELKSTIFNKATCELESQKESEIKKVTYKENSEGIFPTEHRKRGWTVIPSAFLKISTIFIAMVMIFSSTLFDTVQYYEYQKLQEPNEDNSDIPIDRGTRTAPELPIPDSSHINITPVPPATIDEFMAINPAEINSLQNLSIPSPIVIDESSYPPILSVTDISYDYKTAFGIYSFNQSEPHLLRFCTPSRYELINISYFSIQSEPECHIYNSSVIRSNNTNFVNKVVYYIDEDPFGNLTVNYTFLINQTPKIDVNFEPFVQNSTHFSIIWDIVTLGKYIKIGKNNTYYFGNDTSWTPIGNIDNIAEVGDNEFIDSWKFSIITDWSDFGSGDLFVGPVIPEEGTNGTGLRVVFPENVSSLDPTIVGTSSAYYATGDSYQRGTFEYGGYYFAFYFDGLEVVYSTSRNGIDWSSPKDTPATLDGLDKQVYDKIDFDIAQIDNTFAMAWIVDGEYLFIENFDFLLFSKGYIVGDFIYFVNTVVFNEEPEEPEFYQSVSVGIGKNGHFWVGTYNKGIPEVQIYESPDGEIFHLREDFVPLFPDEMVVDIVTMSENNDPQVAVLCMNKIIEGESHLSWKIYSHGAWSILYHSGEVLSGNPENCFSAVGSNNNDGRVYIACTPFYSPNTNYLALIEIYRNIAYPPDIIDDSFDQNEEPSIALHWNNKIHIVWNGDEQIRYIQQIRIEPPFWSLLQNPLYNRAMNINAPTLVGKTMFFIWTSDKQSSPWDIYFLSLPLPAVLEGNPARPWGSTGVSPVSGYFEQLGTYVSPGSGQLTIKQTDLTLSGRGLDLEISRVYRPPRWYHDTPLGLVPYLYEQSPYAEMSRGWQLDFPWISPNFLYLFGGQRYLLIWEDNVFENHLGIDFKLTRFGTLGLYTYELLLSNGYEYHFIQSDNYGDAIGILDHYKDSYSNSIQFHYNMNGIDYIEDSIGRQIQFSYVPVIGKLSSISQPLGGTNEKTIEYSYDPYGNLESVKDPLASLNYDPISGRGPTKFKYEISLNRDLITKIIFPNAIEVLDNGDLIERGFIEYNWYGPVEVSTEVRTFLIATEIVDEYYSAKGNAFSYTHLAGDILSCENHFYYAKGSQGLQFLGINEYDFYPEKLSQMIIKRDKYLTEQEKTVLWFDMNGDIIQEDFYEEGQDEISFSTNYYYDNWGNQIYSKNAIGQETFSSYANTETQYSYYRPGELTQTSNVVNIHDNFDDGDISNYYHTGGGQVTLDSHSLHPYSLCLYDHMDLGNPIVERDVPPVSGHQKINVVVSVDDNNWDYYLIFTDEDVLLMIIFDTDGWIKVSSNYAGNERYLIEYNTKAWYRITIAQVSLDEFAIYVNGIPMLDGEYYDACKEFTIDKIRFRCGDFSTSGAKMWIDEVYCYGGGLREGGEISIGFGEDTLSEGQTAQLLSMTGVQYNIDKVDPNTDSIWLDFPVWASPAMTIKIFNREGILEFETPFHEIFPGAYKYTPSKQWSDMAKIETGFLKADFVYIEDDLPDPDNDYTYGEDEFEWYDKDKCPPNAYPVSGLKSHQSEIRSGWHVHGFLTYSGNYLQPNTGDFHIEYIYLPSITLPSDIAFRYSHLEGSDLVTHHAGWGPGYLDYPPPNAKYMGELPSNHDQWLQLIIRSDDINTVGEDIMGIAYDLWGGQAFFDFSALGDSSTGKIRINGVQPGEHVSLLNTEGFIIADAYASDSWVDLDLYANEINTFPLSAYFEITNIDEEGPNQNGVYKSPLIKNIWGGDIFQYRASNLNYPWLVTSESSDPSWTHPPENIHNRLVGTMERQNGFYPPEVLYLDMDPQMVNGAEVNKLKENSGNALHQFNTRTTETVEGCLYSSSHSMAQEFDGAEYILIQHDHTHSNVLDLNGEFTIAVYLKPDSYGQDSVIIAKGDPANNDGQYMLSFESSSGKLKLTVQDNQGSVHEFLSDYTVDRYIWNHVAVTYDHGRIQFWKNGFPDDPIYSSVSSLRTTGTQSYDLSIGALEEANPVSNFYDGVMDELHIFYDAIEDRSVFENLFNMKLSNSKLSHVTYNSHGSPVYIETHHDNKDEDSGKWANTVSMYYDSYGNVERIRQNSFNGEHETFYTYEHYSAYMNTIVDSLPSQTITTEYEHDFYTGYLSWEKNPRGYTTDYQYDIIGRITAIIHPPDEFSVRYAIQYLYYDDYDNPNTPWDDNINALIMVDENFDGMQKSHHTVQWFDPRGRMFLEERHDFDMSLYSYTEYAHEDRSIGFNYFNQVTGYAITTLDLNTKEYYEIEYDSFGRPVKYIDPHEVHGSTYRIVQYDDIENSVTSIVDINGDPDIQDTHKIKHYSDDLGRLINVEEYIDVSSYYSTSYEYDMTGNLVKSTDSLDKITQYSYDNWDQIANINYPDDTKEFFEYDDSSNLITTITQNNDKFTYTYDDIGRLTNKYYPNNERSEYDYDENSNLIRGDRWKEGGWDDFGSNEKVNDDFGTSQSTPSIAVDNSGENIFVAWHDDREGNWDIYFSESTNGGSSYDSNIKVNDDLGTHDQRLPSIAIKDENNIYVTWHDGRNGYNDIFFAKRINGNNWFETNVQVDDGSDRMKIKPSMSVDSYGDIYIAWEDERNGNRDIYFAKSIDGGQNFIPDPNTKVSNDPGSSKQHECSLAVDDNGIYVVWSDYRNGDPDIYFSKSEDGGFNFVGDVQIDDGSPGGKATPRLAVDSNGYIYVVWADFRNGNYDIYLAKSTDGGQSFGPNIRVNDDGTSLQVHCEIAIDNSDNIYVVWEDWRNGESDIYYTKSTVGGLFFRINKQVDDGSEGWKHQPTIAVDGNEKSFVAWHDHRDGDPDIYFAKSHFVGFISRDTVIFDYDERDRVTNEIQESCTSIYPHRIEFKYGYDPVGNLQTIDYLGGAYTVTYKYDAFNRVISVNAGDFVTVLYNLDDSINIIDYFKDEAPYASTAYEYDSLGRPTRIYSQVSGTSLFDYHYTYDSLSNILDVQETISSTSYSNIYDALSRLIFASGSWGEIIYAHDDVGNRMFMVEDDLQGTIIDKTYSYSGYHNLDSVTWTGGGGGSISYTYDSNGNVITKTEDGTTIQFTYDSENMLVKAIGEDCNFHDATYGPLGKRLYYYDNEFYYATGYMGDLPAYEECTQAGANSKESIYLYLNGMLLARIDYDEVVGYDQQNALLYFHDHLGNVRAVVDYNQDVKFSTDYKPFGELYNTQGTERYTFTGEILDSGTGLIYLRARYYDPEIGRFISQDPVSGSQVAPQTLNRYVYCKNNPLKFTDPSGLIIEDIIDLGNDILNGISDATGLSDEDILTVLFPGAMFILGTFDWWSNRASDAEKVGFLSGIAVAFIIGLAIGLAIPTGGTSLLLLFLIPIVTGAAAGVTYIGVTSALGGTPTMEGFGYAFGWGGIAGSFGFGFGQSIQGCLPRIGGTPHREPAGGGLRWENGQRISRSGAGQAMDDFVGRPSKTLYGKPGKPGSAIYRDYTIGGKTFKHQARFDFPHKGQPEYHLVFEQFELNIRGGWTRSGGGIHIYFH